MLTMHKLEQIQLTYTLNLQDLSELVIVRHKIRSKREENSFGVINKRCLFLILFLVFSCRSCALSCNLCLGGLFQNFMYAWNSCQSVSTLCKPRFQYVFYMDCSKRSTLWMCRHKTVLCHAAMGINFHSITLVYTCNRPGILRLRHFQCNFHCLSCFLLWRHALITPMFDVC